MSIEQPKSSALFKECAALADPALGVLNADDTRVTSGWVCNDQECLCRQGCGVVARSVLATLPGIPDKPTGLRPGCGVGVGSRRLLIPPTSD